MWRPYKLTSFLNGGGGAVKIVFPAPEDQNVEIKLFYNIF